jgi:uncharacterized protein YjiS (DUF1127 family)
MHTLSFPLPFIRSGTGIGHAVQTLAARWRHARQVAEARRYLAQMDDHMLQDLGVSRAQALFEVDAAPPWSPRS